MKKKLVAVLLTVAMVFTMAGCSVGSAPDDSGTDSGTGSVGEDNNSDGKTNTQSKGDGTYKVGIANREITNDYNRLIAYGAQGVLEKAGCEVVMTDAEADVQKHNENVESLLNSGIDALIIQLGDNDQLAPLCADGYFLYI